MRLRSITYAIAIAIAGCTSGCGTPEKEPLQDSAQAVAQKPDDTPELPPVKAGPRYNDRIHINPLGRLADVFNDSNKYHYAHAERLGIRPISRLEDTYFTSRPVVRIESCNLYGVDNLTHSVPYLVPEAARLLADIGRCFIDSLRRRGADGYTVLVTSVLRTPSSVRKLRRVNVNASDSSTHQFGTTFDLSYTRFVCADSTRTINQEDLKNLLAEVLNDKRGEKRCLVKYERKTGCYHVTAIR